MPLMQQLLSPARCVTGCLVLSFCAAAAVAADANEDILTQVIPPKVIQLLSSKQKQDLATTVRLIYMPAPPSELPKMLAMLNAITKTDEAAQTQLRVMRLDAARWSDLGEQKPADLQQYYALNAQKGTLPVVVQMAAIQNSAKSFDPLIKSSNSVAQTEFGRQALKVRASFVEFGTAEKAKADQGVAGAKDALLVIQSQSAQEAVMKLNGTYEAYKQQKSDMLNAIGIAMVIGVMTAPPGPTCESTFVEASAGEAGARDLTGSGFYSKLKTTCK